MYILTTQNGNIAMFGALCERGIFPEADPNTELYKITDSNGNVQYAVADNFSMYYLDDASIPADFYQNPDRYLYKEDEGLVLNPNYAPAPPTPDEMIAQNTAAISYLSIMMGVDISEV